jgi:hypothetical protein
VVCPEKFFDSQNGTLTEIFLATGGGMSPKKKLLVPFFFEKCPSKPPPSQLFEASYAPGRRSPLSSPQNTLFPTFSVNNWTLLAKWRLWSCESKCIWFCMGHLTDKTLNALTFGYHHIDITPPPPGKEKYCVRPWYKAMPNFPWAPQLTQNSYG